MLKKLLEKFRNHDVEVRSPIPQKKLIRLTYASEYDSKSKGRRTHTIENTVSVSRKIKPAKREEVEKEKEELFNDDIDGAVELLIKAGKKLACPFCRARILNEIEYLYRYHYKTMLREANIPKEEVDRIYEERYAGIVKNKVESLKKELLIEDKHISWAVQKKAQEMLQSQM